jgi:tetratricopeptide (TPR) repeat protein
MTKESVLYGIIGILLGFIAGFMFANSVNKNALPTSMVSQTGMPQNTSALPEGHPAVPSNSAGQAQSIAEVQSVIDQARKEPDNFDAQIKAAELNYQIQRFDGALEFLKRANQIKPDDYETIVQLGNVSFDNRNYAEAEKWYIAALAKKPDDISVRSDLGLTYIFRDKPDYERAIQSFQKSLEIEPNNAQTVQNLALAYVRKGDKSNATAMLAKLESIDASNAAIPRLKQEIQNLDIK